MRSVRAGRLHPHTRRSPPNPPNPPTHTLRAHIHVLEVQHVGRGVEHLTDAVAAEFPDRGVARLGHVLLDDAPDVLVGPPGLAELDGFLPVFVVCILVRGGATASMRPEVGAGICCPCFQRFQPPLASHQAS